MAGDECTNCTNAQWEHEWDSVRKLCIDASTNVGCNADAQCNCYRAFDLVEQVSATGKVTAKLSWFAGSFDERGVFRVRIPGSLKRHGVRKGDVIHRINGRKVTPEVLKSFTEKRPIRQCDATRGVPGNALVWTLKARR